MASINTSNQPKITLYWLNQSRSQRIVWLLEELKLPYELVIFHRLPTMFAPPEMKKLHPLGRAPVLTIIPPGASEAVVLAESAFIIEYLLDHYAEGTTLLPKRYKPGQEGKVGGETEEYMRFRYFLHYSEASVMPYLFGGILLSSINSPDLPDGVADLISSRVNKQILQPNHTNNFTFLNNQIKSSSGKYLCGEHLTGADIMMSFPLVASKIVGLLPKEEYPELVAYVEGLESEPVYQKAVDKIVAIEGKYNVL